jgi:PAS domain S-box-containing protein
MQRGAPRIGVWLAIPALAGAAFAGVFGYLAFAFVASEREATIGYWRHDRETTADSRVAAIRQWVTARQGEAAVVAALPSVRRRLSARARPSALAALRADDVVSILTSVVSTQGALRAFVMDAARNVAARDGRPGEIEPGCFAAATAVLTSGVAATDFHKHASGQVAVTFSAPVRDTTPSGVAQGPVLGVVVIAEDPWWWLYPYLSLRLGDARTSESFLVRREGADVRFLSPVRHDPAPPLTLRRSLAVPGFGVADALGVREGFGEYRDYRGAAVLGTTRRVTSTNWVLVTAIERNEALQPFKARMWRDGLTTGAVILAVVGLVLLGRRAQRAAHAADLAQAEAVAKSEDQLSGAMHLAHLGHWEYDVAGDLFTFNDHFYALLGTTADREGGYTMSSERYARRFLPPADQAIVARETQKAVETTDPSYTAELEHRVVFGDGQLGHMAVRISITKDSQGRTVRTYGVNQDVTERALAAEALRASEERFRSVFQAAVDGIAVADSQTGAIVMANQTLCDILGWSEEELLRLRVDDVHPAESLAKTVALFRTQASGLEPLAIGVPVKRRDGSTFIADISAALVVMNGRSCLVRVFRDMTFCRALEAQLRQAQKMEAVGRLAGGVAHDFNNALGVILGHTETLMRQAGEAQRGKLAQILKATQRAAGLTRQLLAFSRKQIVDLKVLDLNALLSNLEKMLGRLIGEDIDLAIVPGADLGRVKADPGQLEQVVMNLCVNARDAMLDGGMLRIETANAELDAGHPAPEPFAPGRYVMLAVSDAGCGIEKEILSKIFEPFFTTKDEGKGTGLGLAIVYGIVKQAGGYVWAYSEVGRGTTFKIYLPRIDEAAVEPEVRETPILARGWETILLVEDEAPLRVIAREILEEHGYRVIEAAGPNEAIEIVHRHPEPIQLLVTDVVMPGMNGRALAESLVAARPELRVLYMSGCTDDILARSGVLESGTLLLEKPFTTLALLGRVRAALRKRGTGENA